MPNHTLLDAPDHVDEPKKVQEYWGIVAGSPPLINR